MAEQRLIDNLENILEEIRHFLDDQLESDDGEQSISKNIIMDFTLMSNKHIPPEACSDEKLLERIHEAEVFFENLKLDISRHEKVEAKTG